MTSKGWANGGLRFTGEIFLSGCDEIKGYKPEEIVAKLRQVDVLVSQGQNMADAIRQIGVSKVTYYRWRQEFGGRR
jgi:putative transposase